MTPSPSLPPPTPTAAPTPDPTATPGPTPTPASTPAPTALPTAVPTPTSSSAQGPTPSATSAPPTPTPDPTPTPAPTPSPTPVPSGLAVPGPEALAASEQACPPVARDFTCITLTLPLDHFAPGTATIDVTFAIRRHTAPGAARGVLVTAVGGPGVSGIAQASGATNAFASSIRARYDLVFFDQRGVGLSDPIACPDAALAWRDTDATEDADLIAAAERFATDCVRESGVDPAVLRFLDTRQAAADLEALRIYLAAETWLLRGESYGSQLVQDYAVAHPERVAALVLDGPIDPTRTAAEFWIESARAYDQTLAASLLECTTVATCTRDVRGGDALAAYDALAARLAEGGPIPVPVTTAAGRPGERPFSAADLAATAAAYLDDETDRMLLQRAVAAASQGRWWYLARMHALTVGADQETGEAVRDPSRSAALHYAVGCADHQHVPGDASPLDRAAAWLALGREGGVDAGRLARVFATDLPCAFWPARAASPDRPAGVESPAFDLIVMGATLDPITPWANGERVVSTAGARRAAAIVTAGGPHVTFGRGRTCPDRLVTAYLVVGNQPPARTTCPGSVADAYVPIPNPDRAGYNGTREAVLTVDRELLNAPDFVAWTRDGELRFGCPFGGWVSYTPGGGQADVRLQRCAWSEGVPITGEGVIALDNQAVRLTLDSGDPDRPVTYARTGRGEISLSGTLGVLER